MKSERIRSRVFFPLALALLALVGAFVVGIYWFQRHRVDDQLTRRLDAINETFQQELSEDAELMHGLIDMFEQKPELRQAWRTADRRLLQEAAQPVFEHLRQEYQITHFYFHTLERTCFLRVHCPNRYGDRIERFTMAEAAESGDVAHGIELGPLGTFTLRVVHPWQIDGELAGYIELGEEIEHVTPRVKDVLDVELMFTVEKAYLNREGWEEGQRLMGRSADWDRFDDVVVIDSTLDSVAEGLDGHFTCSEDDSEETRFDISIAGRKYRGGHRGLCDASGRCVGEIYALADMTAEMADLKGLLSVLIGAGALVSGALCTVLWFYLGSVQRRLIAATDGLQAELQKGRRREAVLQEKETSLRDEVRQRTEAEASLAHRVGELAEARTAAINAMKDLERENEERIHAEEALAEKSIHLDNILRSATEYAIITVDLDFRVTYYNPKAATFFGYSAEEVVGKTVHEMHLKGGLAPDRFERAVENVGRNGEHCFCMRRQIGETTRDFEARVSAILDPHGYPVGYALFCLDVTERRRAEGQAMRFGRILESSLNEIYIFDARSLRFVQVNRGARDNLGYSMEDLRELTPLDLKPEFTTQQFEDLVAPLRDGTQQTIRFTTNHRRKDGSLYPVEVALQLSERDTGGVFVAVILDVTERMRAEKELRDYSHALESANRALEEFNRAAQAATQAKSEFLANMSHEIRTPMTAILGYADLLLDAELSDDQRREHVNTIRRNGRVLIELINDILDLSKIEAGKMDVRRTEFSPCGIVEDVVSLMRVRAEAEGLALKTRLAYPLPGTIRSDPVRLRQILVNLVGNAIKFTETGSVTIAVCCEAADGNGDGRYRMRFDVIDTGVGIAPEKLQKLFEPFTQADASATRRFGGTGLGLTISKRLAELLGGDVRVESHPGRGSTFTLTVNPGPLGDVPMLNGPDDRAGEELPEEADRQEATPSKLNGRVLLAEDGPDNQRLICALLEKAGLDVELADNGVLACEKAVASQSQGKPYDLILMDIQMPDMDGYQATQKLREDGWQGPIVALTAHAMVGDRDKCLEAGCNDYATKPIERAKLLGTVALHLGNGKTAGDGPAANESTEATSA